MEYERNKITMLDQIKVILSKIFNMNIKKTPQVKLKKLIKCIFEINIFFLITVFTVTQLHICKLSEIKKKDISNTVLCDLCNA